jgi:branched-subunit amino acid aminotransferase/4-amino-4-deoxychorismate lyase
MSQPQVQLDELWWAEPPLKQRLTQDPLSVLREQGYNLPPNLPRKIVYDIVRIISLLWVDGKLTPREKFTIDPADEGLLFGRGVWESTRTVNGVPWLWRQHIERLKRTAELLEIPLAPERLPTGQQVTEFVRSLCGTDVLVRLNVTAGRPGKAGVIWMSAGVRPSPEESVRLQTTRNPVPKGQPYLVWKTFQYATRLRTGQQAAKAGYDTALLLDDENNLLEASHANLFVRLPDGWVTPPVDGGLLPGTVRQHLLEESPLRIREEKISYGLLGTAREVFLTNSNVGIVPVTVIDQHTFSVGSETQELSRWLIPDSEK